MKNINFKNINNFSLNISAILLLIISTSLNTLAKEIKNSDDLIFSEFYQLELSTNKNLPSSEIKTSKNNPSNNSNTISQPQKRIMSDVVSDQLLNKISKDYIAGQPILVIRDPFVLEQLENKGLSLSQLLAINEQSNEKINDSSNITLDQLYKTSSAYKQVADIIRADLNELLVEENKNSKLNKVGVGMTFSKRLLDPNWFISPYAKFELVGLINRIDRASFDVNTCGETRLIYRLSYTSKINNYSRLPVTFMLKFTNKTNNNETSSHNSSACLPIAKQWTYPKEISSNAELLQWIINEGPAKSVLNSLPKSIEMNLQALRIPSKARADLAGHGTYLLRGFQFDSNKKLIEEKLENTPDVKKILSSGLKKEFLQQFENTDFINRLSEGILKLDDKYLATKVWSYSPYGIARKENRLFDQFITEEDLKKYKFNQSKYVTNAQAALMRLNDYTCVGCHQARAHAGFHYLGVDKPNDDALKLNVLLFEGSGHFELEKSRRASYMEELLQGHWPNPTRDFSISPGVEYNSDKGGSFKQFKKAGRGHFCGLPGGPFQHWQCEPDLTCQSIDEAEGQKILGKCFSKEAMAGDPVLIGYLKQSDHNSDSFQVLKTKSCGSLKPKMPFSIFDKSGGFPSGQCYRKNCSGIDANDKTEACADSAGDGFNDCMAKTASGKISNKECTEKFLVHYGFAKCSENQSCRNDFVCAKSIEGQGYCTPSYFLIQVRLDGHADPLKGL